MILRGILDRSLSSQLCIRGFAPIKELARISKADYSYQRVLLPEQEKEIKTFLDEEEYLFFPEVILSYRIKYELLDEVVNQTPIQVLTKAKEYKSNVDETTLKIKHLDYKGSSDTRIPDKIEVVELSIPDNALEELIENDNHPFHRIDGNHRLSAATFAKSDKVKRMKVPYCIILSEELLEFDLLTDKKKHIVENEKFEKMVFHNINTKTIPLTSEENLRVILRDERNFKNQEIKKKGWEYFASRAIVKELPENLEQVFPHLGDQFSTQPYTISKEVSKLLFDDKVIQRRDSNIKKVRDAIDIVNQSFSTHGSLLQNVDKSIIVAAIYVQIKTGGVKNFLGWVVSNHIYESKELLASSLIKIYSKIDQSKRRQIFVSMQFDQETKPHFLAIKRVIESINLEHKLDIKIRQIRIDEFNQGHSYKIDDEILKLIDDSGLLIADITAMNVNVYQELGYLMGLNDGRGLKQENFILIKKNDPVNENDGVGFNIRPYQQLRFNNTEELAPKLKASIEKHYNLTATE